MPINREKTVVLTSNGYNYKAEWSIQQFLSFTGNSYDSPLFSFENIRVKITVRNSLNSQKLEIMFNFSQVGGDSPVDYHFIIQNKDNQNSDIIKGSQIINSQRNQFSIYSNKNANEINEENGFIVDNNLNMVCFFHFPTPPITKPKIIILNHIIRQSRQKSEKNDQTNPKLEWTINEPIGEFHMTETPIPLKLHAKEFNIAFDFIYDNDIYQLSFDIDDESFSFTGSVIVTMLNQKNPAKSLKKLHNVALDSDNAIDPFDFYEVTSDELNDQNNGWILYSDTGEITSGLHFTIEFIENKEVRIVDENLSKEEILQQMLESRVHTEKRLKERDPITIKSSGNNKYLIPLTFPNASDLTNDSKLETLEYHTGQFCTKYYVAFSSNNFITELTNYNDQALLKFTITFVRFQNGHNVIINKNGIFPQDAPQVATKLPYTLESLKNQDNGWLDADGSFHIEITINSRDANASWNQQISTNQTTSGYASHKYEIPLNLFFDKQCIEFPPLSIKNTSIRIKPTITIDSDQEITTSVEIIIPKNTCADYIFTYQNNSNDKNITTIFCDSMSDYLELKPMPKVSSLESEGFVFTENGKKFLNLFIRLHNSFSSNYTTSNYTTSNYATSNYATSNYTTSNYDFNPVNFYNNNSFADTRTPNQYINNSIGDQLSYAAKYEDPVTYYPHQQNHVTFNLQNEEDPFAESLDRIFNDTENVYIPSYDRMDDNGSKQRTGYVGLHNQGATCYMNSLLQSLFHLPQFRRLVYEMPTTGTEIADKSIPLNLQRLFCQMQFSDKSCSTVGLTQSFGWTSAETFMQHDVEEFLRVLIDNLETKMKGTNLAESIPALLRGQYRSYIKCKNVDYQSSRVEDFYDLSMNIKNLKNLDESFRNYIQPDELVGKNQYKTDDFGLQDAIMGTEFLSFPPVLHIQLRRFMYGPNGMFKINDHFEFPPTIDLSPYLAPDAPGRAYDNTYDLYGVLVHSGSGLGGHYYAFLRTSTSEQWYKFNDSFVEKDTFKHAVEDNYGNPISAPKQTNPSQQYSRNISQEAGGFHYTRIEDDNYASDEDDVNEDWEQIEQECNQEAELLKLEKSHNKSLAPTSSQGVDVCTGTLDDFSIRQDSSFEPVHETKRSYSGYMLIYVRRSDAPYLYEPIPDDSVPKHLRDYFESQNEQYQPQEEDNRKAKSIKVHFVHESILRTNSADRIRGFKQLNKDLFNRDIEICAKSISTNILYENLAKRINIEPGRIRLWKCTHNFNPIEIIPNDSKTSITSYFKHDSANIFIQSLNEEEQLQIAGNIVIYIKFFFSSKLLSKQIDIAQEKLHNQLEAPLQYLFSIQVDPKLPIQSIVPLIHRTIGLPEEIELCAYQETMTSSILKLSLDQPIQSGQIGNGSILIFQCRDPEISNFPSIEPLTFDFQPSSCEIHDNRNLPFATIVKPIDADPLSSIETFSLIEDLITFEVYKYESIDQPELLTQFTFSNTCPQIVKILKEKYEVPLITFGLIDNQIVRIDNYLGGISKSFSVYPPKGLKYNRIYYLQTDSLFMLNACYSFDGMTEIFQQKIYYPAETTYAQLISFYKNILISLKPILINSASENGENDIGRRLNNFCNSEAMYRIAFLDKNGIISIQTNLDEQVQCLKNEYLRIELVPKDQVGLSTDQLQAVSYISEDKSNNRFFVIPKYNGQLFKDTKERLNAYLPLQANNEFIRRIHDMKPDTVQIANDTRHQRQDENSSYSFDINDGDSEFRLDDYAALSDFPCENSSRLIIRSFSSDDNSSNNRSQNHLNPSRSVKIYH